MPHTSNAGHLTKHFNTQICEAFTADLRQYIETGLPGNEAEAGRQWLRDIEAAASALPDGALPGKKIKNRCEAIATEYDRWASREGTRDLRARQQWRMKHKVDKLADTYRRRTSILEKQTDPQTYRAFYQATEKLVQTVPHTLPTVGQTLLKYPNPS